MKAWMTSLVAALLVAAVVPQAAQAAFGFKPGSVEAALLDANGQPELRAGATPDRLVARFAFNIDGDTVSGTVDGNMRDLVMDLPPGFAGYPTKVPVCSRKHFSAYPFSVEICPPETQIGVVRAALLGFGDTLIEVPLYNVEPSDHHAAEFGYVAVLIPTLISASVRTDQDHGMRIALRNLNQGFNLSRGEVELWGVPADRQTGTTTARRPFLRNPTRCDTGPLTSVIRARTWQEPDTWHSVSHTQPAAMSGCGSLPFNPGFDATPDSSSADTPSGLGIEIAVPESEDPDGPASSQLEEAVITLPEGMSLTPAVADGLEACDDPQLGVGSTGPPACPESSKIATVALHTTMLEEPLRGGVYLGKQLPDDKYRLFVTAGGQSVWLKLRASLRPDPATGRLTAVLSNLPELPLTRLELRFKGGPRAPIATPPTCGTDNAEARLTPWSGGTPVTVTAPVTISSGPGGAACPAAVPFAPAVTAGSTPARAAGDTTVSVTVRRPDGHETIDRMRVVLPRGVTARLARAEQCPMPVAQAAGCPAASRVGSMVIEGGAGTDPFPLTGDVYLTGPYRDAPFGLALTVRALAGPLDLGTIVVPTTLDIDPLDGRLTIATDSVPTVVEGIPLRLQTVGVDIDRPGFMLNPTSCRASHVDTSVRGGIVTTVERKVPFTLAGCGTLRFRPAVALSLSGRRELRRGGHPSLGITVRQRAGEANLRTTAVALPRAFDLHEAGVNVVCSRERARDGRCSSGSKVGTARVRTPLLDVPLTGPVYAVRPRAGETPDLWANVTGGGLRLTLRSSTVVRRGAPVRTSFTDLPDLPMSSFSLTLRGGERGVLTVVKDLCHKGRARALVARTDLGAQNGKRSARNVRIKARPPCGR